ncbi:MAG: hypothetical protein IKT35_04950, partial [Clostridia bacterium]|nr:hypothetical protein [Clostridia bacterium]
IIDEASKFTTVFGSANSDASTYKKGVHYKITENLTITGDYKANKMLFQGVLFADTNKTITFSSIPNMQYYLNELKSDADMGIDNNNRIAYATLFLATKGATIKNLTLNGTMTNSNANLVGAFVAVAHSTVIENCVNNIDMPCSSSGKNGAVGGFVGAARTGTVITNCINNGDVTGTNAVGGIVGDSCATITNCKNYGNITGTNNVDGIAGKKVAGGTVSGDCENFGTIVSK